MQNKLPRVTSGAGFELNPPLTREVAQIEPCSLAPLLVRESAHIQTNRHCATAQTPAARMHIFGGSAFCPISSPISGPISNPNSRSTRRSVRTFVGSRGSSVDTTFDPFGGDCNWEGWPSWESYAINMHNNAVGDPWQSYNGSAAADGIVGGVLPNVIFYLPMYNNGSSRFRYWTYFAVPVGRHQLEPFCLVSGWIPQHTPRRSLHGCGCPVRSLIAFSIVAGRRYAGQPRAVGTVPFPASRVFWPQQAATVQARALADVLGLILVLALPGRQRLRHCNADSKDGAGRTDTVRQPESDRVAHRE